MGFELRPNLTSRDDRLDISSSSVVEGNLLAKVVSRSMKVYLATAASGLQVELPASFRALPFTKGRISKTP